MDNKPSFQSLLQQMLQSSSNRPEDFSHLHAYEEVVRNTAARAREMEGGFYTGLSENIFDRRAKKMNKSSGETATIKQLPSGNFYFLQKGGEPVAGQGSFVSRSDFDVKAIRKDFPILQEKVHGKNLVWLDNAATTQKPNQVIDTISNYYRRYNSNVHRGAHALAARATDAYEEARQKVALFMGAARASEIVFVRGTTEAINLIAQTFGKQNIGPGDEIVLSASSHHANIVPWQMLADEKGAKLKVIPFHDTGELDMAAYRMLLNPRVKIVAVDHVSNVLGTVNPIREMTALAHANGAVIVIDGAQSIPHFRPNMQEVDCDFYVFSGHKIYGPTGIGAVYGKTKHWETIPPFQGGGNMIDKVSFTHTTYQQPPYKFEAGTASIADAIGLGAALEYVQQIGFERAGLYEKELIDYGMQLLSTVPGLQLIGTTPTKVGVISFIINGIANEDMGKYLDSEGIAVRSGHHCAQPTLAHFGLTSCVRPSVSFYNTAEEIEYLFQTVKEGAKKVTG